MQNNHNYNRRYSKRNYHSQNKSKQQTTYQNANIKCNQQGFKYLVVLDFEATCEQNKIISPQEIIEWPAIIINTSTFQILRNKPFHHYIKPKYKPKLTKFCTELTGITQSLIETQGSKNTVQSVIAAWNKWCFVNDLLPDSSTKPKACIVTHGDWDLKTMWSTQQNISKCNTPCLFHSWINVKTIFKYNLWRFNNNRRELRGLGMMAILNYLNIKHEGRHHSGIDDVKNICKIVQKLLVSGVQFDDYTTTQFGGRSIWTDINVKINIQRSMQKHKINDNNDEQKVSQNARSNNKYKKKPPSKWILALQQKPVQQNEKKKQNISTNKNFKATARK